MAMAITRRSFGTIAAAAIVSAPALAKASVVSMDGDDPNALPIAMRRRLDAVRGAILPVSQGMAREALSGVNDKLFDTRRAVLSVQEVSSDPNYTDRELTEDRYTPLRPVYNALPFQVGLGSCIRFNVSNRAIVRQAIEIRDGLFAAHRATRDAMGAVSVHNSRLWMSIDGAPGPGIQDTDDLSLEGIKRAIDWHASCGQQASVLVVHPSISDEAERISPLPVTSWGALPSERGWFVLTGRKNFFRMERIPFELDAWCDKATGNILVKSYERYCFTAFPDQVYASVPDFKVAQGAFPLLLKKEGMPTAFMSLDELRQFAR